MVAHFEKSLCCSVEIPEQKISRQNYRVQGIAYNPRPRRRPGDPPGSHLSRQKFSLHHFFVIDRARVTEYIHFT